MTEETEETKLHFTRVRSKGDSSFYDPQSDIRVILPTVAKMTLDVLMQVNTDDWLKKEFSYLAKCYAIYQIRLAEDSTNMVQQVAEFENAVQKASPRAKMLWMHAMFALLNAVYGLFTRRDAKTDGAAIRGMLNTAQQAAVLSLVTPEQAKDIINKFRERGELYEESPSIDINGVAVCIENDEVVKNIKQLAHVFIDHTGSDDWNELSKACDAYFLSADADKLDNQSAVAVALAYPSYEKPYLEAVADK